jgi:predicted dehydrogenase
MIAARDAARLPLAIGFQDVYQPAVAILKDRLLAGEFGKPLRARVIGCWPRSERYFNRNAWAGKFRRGDGCWIMDSPASNALAHFLHLALFLLGPTRDRSADVTEVAAELYRANRIENYDTCSMRFMVGGDDVPLVVAYTHACAQPLEPVVSIDTERGQIRYVAGGRIELRMRKPAGYGNGDGRGAHSGDGHANGGGHAGGNGFAEVPEVLRLSSNPYKHMFAAFATWLRENGDADGSAAPALGSTLEMARAHVVAVNAASEHAPIADVPEEFVDTISTADQSLLRAIRDIVPALESCTRGQCLLHETGRAPWSYPPARKAINGYKHFAGPAAGAKESQGPHVTVRTFVADSVPTHAPITPNVADRIEVPPLPIYRDSL